MASSRGLVPAARYRGVWLAALMAALLVASVVGRVSSAAFTSKTDTQSSGWQSGFVQVTDDDAGAAMFSTASNTGALDGGSVTQRCIVVTYSGTINNGSVEVHSYVTGVSGALAANMDLVVEEGTGGSNGSCTGFTPSASLFSGTLANYGTAASNFASGLSTWSPSTGDTKSYRFTTTVRNTPAAQGSTAAATFMWEARSGMPFNPAKLASKSLWVRANDLGSAGTSVTSWGDRAGMSTPVAIGTAPTVAASSTPAGGKSVRFNNNGAIGFGDVGLTTQSGSPGMYATGQVSNLFDSNNSTDWRDDGPGWPRYATFMTAAPFTVTSYKVKATGVNDIFNPTSWKVYGSNDNGKTWTMIDSRTGQSLSAAGLYTFTVTGAAAYVKYKFEALGSTSGSIVMFSGLDLYNGVTKATIAPQYNPAMEAWFVLKADPYTSPSSGLWDMSQEGASTTSTSRYPWTSNTTMRERFGYPNGNVGTYDMTLNVPDTRQWRILRMVSDTPGGVDIYSDGVLLYHGNASLGNRLWNSNMTVGKAAGGAYYWSGNIAEILVRPVRSTATEASNIIRYLDAEHGLTVPAP